MKRRVVSIHSWGLYVFYQHIWAFETAIDVSSVLGGLIFFDPLMHKIVKWATSLLSLPLSQDFDSEKQLFRFWEINLASWYINQDVTGSNQRVYQKLMVWSSRARH